jgi:hypothetical protein
VPTTAQRPGRTKVLSSRAARAWSLPASDVFRIIVTGPADSKSASISPRSTSSAAPAARRGSRTPASRWAAPPLSSHVGDAKQPLHRTIAQTLRRLCLGDKASPLGEVLRQPLQRLLQGCSPGGICLHEHEVARGTACRRVDPTDCLLLGQQSNSPMAPMTPPCGGRATHRCCNEDANAQ